MIFKNPFTRSMETKAVNSAFTGQVTSVLPDFPSYTTLSSDSVSVIQYQRGYAAACINLISKTVGALPFYLYRVQNAETGTYLGKSIKVKTNQLDRRVAKSIAKGDYTLTKVFDHPFLDLIEADDDMSTEEMLALVTGYTLAIGNSYIQVVRDSNGSVVKLKPLMSEFMSVKYDNQYNIIEYIYTPALTGYTQLKLSPADVIHISRKSPGSVVVGRGLLEDTMVTVGVAEEAKKFTQCLLQNHMAPSKNIVVKNSIKSEAEATRIKDKIAENFSGNNRGKAIVTFGDVEITDGSTKMRDQTVLELCEYCNKEIAAIFGVPMDLLDQSNANRASIISAKNNFLSMTVVPIASAICDQITKFIASEYDKSFMLGFDTTEAMETDPVAQAALYKSYVDTGIMTKDEVREKLGMEPLPSPEPGQALPPTSPTPGA